jgi:hypothetical protein
MQRPTLLEGIFIALVASLAIGPLLAVLHLGLGAVMAWKGALVVVAYTYIVYLLIRRGKMPGRTVLALFGLLVCLACLILEIRWPTLAFVAMALVAGMRAYAYSQSLVPGLLHAGLCLLGLGAALWAYAHSSSLALASWSFFLVQAMFVLLPTRPGQQSHKEPHPPGGQKIDDFVVAHQAAQKALGRLSLSAS